MDDHSGDAFILNRYFTRQFDQWQNRRQNCYKKKPTSSRAPIYDLNANEYVPRFNDVPSCGQSRFTNGDYDKARIYYDLPALCLDSAALDANEAATSPPKVDSVTFTRKTDNDSPSRSSHAKVPNCLRRKQQAIKSKYIKSCLDSKTTYNVDDEGAARFEDNYQSQFKPESLSDHELYPDLLDLNSCFNECWNVQKPTGSEVVRDNNKRIYDRLKRSHIRHIVKSTREKINQSLSNFKRASSKPRKARFTQDFHHNGSAFFSNSHSDSDLHLSVQRYMGQEAASQSYKHLVMQCRETQFVLSRFSSVDNFFDEACKTPDFENELNHAKKKSFLRSNFLRRNKRIGGQRDNELWRQRQQQPQSRATSRSISSYGTADESNESDNDDDCHLTQTVLSTGSEERRNAETKQLQFSRSCTPFEVPDWNELCNRIYRFRLQLPMQPRFWMESSTNLAQKEGKPQPPVSPPKSCPETELLLASSTDLFSPLRDGDGDSRGNSSTSSQPKVCVHVQDLLETAGPIEPKNKFDVEQFIRCVAKRIFAIGQQLDDSAALEAVMEQLEYSQLDDAFRHVNHLAAVRAYKSFLVDLCVERTKCTFFTETDCSPPHISLMSPLRSQKQPWPSTEDRFVQVLLDQMMHLAILSEPAATEAHQSISAKRPYFNERRNGKKSAQEVKRFGLMAYCRKQRALDLVDSVLYREMLDDEHRWSFHGPDMLQIKRQLLLLDAH